MGSVKFYQQWERQLMWATLKALIDHEIVPRREAIGLAKRLSTWALDEFAPLVEKHLGKKP